CGQSDYYLNYSLDGGKHWTQVYTSGSASVDGSFGWVGTALFSTVAPPGTPTSATQNLAVSKNGGPFSWTSLPYAGGSLLSTATTLYVNSSVGLYSTMNLGASLARVTPAYQGNTVSPTT